MPTVVLKKTRAKPTPVFQLPGFKVVGYKYLYTNTGKASDWGIAVQLTFKKGQEAPDEVTIRVELRDD